MAPGPSLLPNERCERLIATTSKGAPVHLRCLQNSLGSVSPEHRSVSLRLISVRIVNYVPTQAMLTDGHAFLASLPRWKPQDDSYISALLDALPPEKMDGNGLKVQMFTPTFALPRHVGYLPSWSLSRWLCMLAERLGLSPCAILSFDRGGPTPLCYADDAKLVPSSATDIDPYHIIDTVKHLERHRDWDEFRTVYRTGHGVVVKKIYDPEAALSEALNLAMIRSVTSIPVPELRRVVVDGSTTYLVMECIEGDSLKDRWPHLSLWSRLSVAWTLRGYVAQLRRLRRSVPGTLPGGRCNGPLFTEDGAGPFHSYSDMIAWFNHKLEVSQRMNQAPINAPRFDSRSPLVFTHQDLCPRNVMLAHDGTLYLIDWEYAGFYPEWFEYTTMLRQTDLPISWRWMVPLIAGWFTNMARCVSSISWALSTGAMM